MKHSARIDWCVFAAIALAIAATFWGVSAWITGPETLILMLCAYPQSYETIDSGVQVHDAVASRLIPYGAITQVAPAKSSMWLPARIRVQYGLSSEIYLAPADQAAFLAAVEGRSPHLVRRGTQLMLRDRHAEYRLERTSTRRLTDLRP
jgi:hypothetical protein